MLLLAFLRSKAPTRGFSPHQPQASELWRNSMPKHVAFDPKIDQRCGMWITGNEGHRQMDLLRTFAQDEHIQMDFGAHRSGVDFDLVSKPKRWSGNLDGHIMVRRRVLERLLGQHPRLEFEG